MVAALAGDSTITKFFAMLFLQNFEGVTTIKNHKSINQILC
jgi:stress-induced morphogen